MVSLNKVLLIGNLTRDPELKSTSSGRKVCELRLAVNRRYRTAKGEDRDETCYIDVRVWDRQGELCKEHLQKGMSVFVEGRLVFETWERKDGGRGSRHSVLAERIQFLDRRRSPAEGTGEISEPPPEGGGDVSTRTEGEGGSSGDEEDLPF